MRAYEKKPEPGTSGENHWGKSTQNISCLENKTCAGGDSQKIAGADPGDPECPVDWLPSVQRRN